MTITPRSLRRWWWWQRTELQKSRHLALELSGRALHGSRARGRKKGRVARWPSRNQQPVRGVDANRGEQGSRARGEYKLVPRAERRHRAWEWYRPCRCGVGIVSRFSVRPRPARRGRRRPTPSFADSAATRASHHRHHRHHRREPVAGARAPPRRPRSRSDRRRYGATPRMATPGWTFLCVGTGGPAPLSDRTRPRRAGVTRRHAHAQRRTRTGNGIVRRTHFHDQEPQCPSAEGGGGDEGPSARCVVDKQQREVVPLRMRPRPWNPTPRRKNIILVTLGRCRGGVGHGAK